jgi:hypothetical protein
MNRKCDQCGKPLKSRYGLDLLGRSYCKRWSCTVNKRVRKWMKIVGYKLIMLSSDVPHEKDINET